MSIRRCVLRFSVVAFIFLAFAGCRGSQVQSAKAYGPLGPQSDRARGEQRVLIVTARFPDVKPNVTLERIKRKAVKGLSRYIREQSYGLTWVNPDFRGEVTLPEPVSAYKVSPYNFRVDRTRVRKLVEDAMTRLESDVDFSRYDHFLIIPRVTTRPGSGYGMICYCANPGMLSGVRKNAAFVKVASKGGQEFEGGIFVGAENAHLGMYAHDFFHALGGIEASRRLVP